MYFLHFIVIPNAFALMFSPLKSSAFFLRDAKNPDADLESTHILFNTIWHAFKFILFCILY